ncbi:uncharacterized protein LOC142538568 [Primulina tabacum]|uniref:uncharacterized protein LOC142538568 n=1 Tax=Primulina tabacum TaxID=48773 RepID=UPI003F5A20E2
MVDLVDIGMVDPRYGRPTFPRYGRLSGHRHGRSMLWSTNNSCLVDQKDGSTMCGRPTIWSTIAWIDQRSDEIFRCKLTIQSRYKDIAEMIHRYLNNDERTFFSSSRLLCPKIYQIEVYFAPHTFPVYYFLTVKVDLLSLFLLVTLFEIDSSSQTQRIFEPNLPVITEESSENIQVTPDAGMSGGEATTSRANRQFGAIIDDSVRPLAETVTFKVNNSLARVRASMLDRLPSRIPGFYAEYEKSFYGSMAITNSHVTVSHIGKALCGLLEMQIRHPEVMSPDVSLMDTYFYNSMLVLAEDEDKVVNTNLVGIMKGIDPKWPCLSWKIARRILISVHTDGRWFLLKLVAGVNKCIIVDLQRRHDPNLKALNEEIEPILVNDVRLLSIVGNNPHHERPCEYSGAFVLAVAGYALSRRSEQIVLNLDDRLVSEFRYFLACNMFDN